MNESLLEDLGLVGQVQDALAHRGNRLGGTRSKLVFYPGGQSVSYNAKPVFARLHQI